MDWSRAKTIFIITFFILDVFLLYQLIYQKNEHSFEPIQKASIEEQLRAENITVNQLPTEPTSANYIEANTKEFSEEDLSDIPSLAKQSITNYNSGILSELIQPYALPKDWEVEDVNEFVKNYVFKGEQYKYWDYDKRHNMITYYQLYNGRMLYNNSSAQLKITLNEDNEIIGYSQTILENIKDIKEQDIITAYEALSILYTKGLLQSDSTVSTVELGYYMLVPGQSSSAQLLAPTWCFMIDGKVEYFVNAIEGHVFNEEREILE